MRTDDLVILQGSTWEMHWPIIDETGAPADLTGCAWLVSDPSVYPNGWALQGAPTTAWAVGVSYKVGDHVTYQSSTYQCLTAHTSQAGWDPADAPSLWQKL